MIKYYCEKQLFTYRSRPYLENSSFNYKHGSLNNLFYRLSLLKFN